MLPSCAYPGGRRGTGRHGGRAHRRPPSRRQQLLPDSWSSRSQPEGYRAALRLAPGPQLAVGTPPLSACGAAAVGWRAASSGADTARAWPHPAQHSMGWSLLQLQLPHPTRLKAQPTDTFKPQLPYTWSGRIRHDGAKHVTGTSS